METRISNINLNLLMVLDALLETESVTLAADRIGRTPSAVSTSLAQLRDILGDPLFVRVGARLQPTARAMDLTDLVKDAIAQMEMIFVSPDFDPSQSERSFVIAATDTTLLQAGVRIAQEVRKLAPKITVEFSSLEPGIAEGMARRTFDFVIMPKVGLASLAPVQLGYEHLGEVALDAALMDKNHELAGRTELDPKELEAYGHVAFRPNSSLTKFVKSHQMMHYKAEIAVSQNMVIPALLEGTNLVSVVNYDMTRREAADRGLVFVPLSPPLSLPFGLAWSSLLQRDATHLWFQNTVKKIFRADR